MQLPMLDYAFGVSFIFLPAGIRTLAVLIFGFRGALGIFTGTMLSSVEYMHRIVTMDLPNIILIAAISAFSAYLMMQLVCWFRNIGSNLDELNFSDLLAVVFTQGLLSASLHQWLYAQHSFGGAYNEPSAGESFRLWAAMAAGDVIGSMVMMLSAVALINLFSRFRRA